MIDWLDTFFKNIFPMHMYFAFQILAAELMFAVPLKKRGDKKALLPVLCLFYLVLCWFHPLMGHRFARVFCIFVESMLVLFLALEVPLKSVLFIGAASYGIQNLAYETGSLVIQLLGTHGTTLNKMIAAIVFIAVYILCWNCFVRNFPASGEIFIGDRVCYGLTILTLSIVFFRFAYMSVNGIEKDRPLTITCIILVLILQFNTLRKSQVEEENSIIVKLLAQSNARQKILTENIDIINMKSHDLKYHIDQYKKENNLEVHSKFFQDVEKAVNIYDRIVKTGNAALDVLLSEKLLYCEAKKIDVSYMVDAEALQFMDSSDIYSLFGNALDNAIESVAGEEEGTRIISLCVRTVKGNSNIIIENYCSRPPVMEDGLPQSKKDRNLHGFGVRSIRYIVEKYGGSMVIGTGNNLFTLTILIPNDLNQENGSEER